MGKTNLRPLGDRVLVRPVEEEEKAGGIIIPDVAKERPSRGEVVAAGPGAPLPSGGRLPLDVRVGDRVLYAKYSGQEIQLDGETFLIMHEAEISGVLEG